jgi:hypothetical protein
VLQCLSPGERSKKSFYDDNENNTFGVVDKKEGTYNPKSDFAFTISHFVRRPCKRYFKAWEHHSFTAILMLGAGAMSLHYLTILENNKNCPVAVAYGPSGTAKTTGLFAALSIIGAHEHNFYSRGTKESYVSILSKQTVPIGLDDPQSSKNVSELLMDLFGGAKSTLFFSGYGQRSRTSFSKHP